MVGVPAWLLHPPPHDTGWQFGINSHVLGSVPSRRAGLRPQITAGWVGLAGLRQGSKNKFQIGSNREGAGAALVNKISYGVGRGSAPGPPTIPLNSHNRQWAIARIYN